MSEKTEIPQRNHRHSQGSLAVVGIGPGAAGHRTLAAIQAIREADTIIGYRTYIDLIADLITTEHQVIGSGMRKEIQRCQEAISHALAGHKVALISSGDPGIYGMAGLVLELMKEQNQQLTLQIIPGVSAAQTAAAALGAPLMCDYAVISLSDLLVPWEVIRHRLQAVAEAGLVVALYNPRSKKRTTQLPEALSIFQQHRPGSTPAAIVTEAGCPEQEITLSTLAELPVEKAGMRSIVIIGNENSRIFRDYLFTTRGYLDKYHDQLQNA